MSTPEIEIYYHSRKDFKFDDTLSQVYVPLSGTLNTGKTSLKDADLYSQDGVLTGKLFQVENILNYNIKTEFDTLVQSTNNYILQRGNLSGTVSVLSFKDDIVFTPTFKTGYYYDKKVTIHATWVDDYNTRKTTIYIQ